MANQTVTTTVNYDSASISGLLDGETITINGGSVTIDSDVRWNQQAAVFGSITVSAPLGGSLLLDGRNCWELYFTASTGNVPTQAALNSNGVVGGTSGATGELLRVWATGSLTPSTAGGAMPATGWIKLRSKTGTFQAGEIVTLPGGATITLQNAGKRSWLHIVGRESSTFTFGKSATFWARGDYYELGTTTGLNNQTLQFPVLDFCPAIQIETSAGSGVYEWYNNAGERWGTATQMVATDLRGKMFGQNLTTGVITLAQTTGATCGFLPPAGCKIRIPNLILSQSNNTNWALNTAPTSSSSRYLISTTRNANYEFDKVLNNWFLQPQNFINGSITNSCWAVSHQPSFAQGTVTVDNCANGIYPGQVYTGFSSTQISGATITNCKFVCNNHNTAVAINDSNNVTFSNNWLAVFGGAGSQDRTTTAVTADINRCSNWTVNNHVSIGGRFNLGQAGGCSNFTIQNFRFADRLFLDSQTGTWANIAAINIINGSSYIRVNGYSALNNNPLWHPTNPIVSASGSVSNVIVENIGTVASPIDFGNTATVFFNVSNAINCYLRRCYASNTRSGAGLVSAFSNYNIQMDNVGCDYADTSLQLTGNDSWIRGVKATASVSAVSGIRGSHWMDNYLSATTGRIYAVANEPTVLSAPQCSFSFGAGSQFTGESSATMVNIGDWIEFTTPYFIKGHTSFQNVAPTITGTNTTNFTYTFQYDVGSGWNGTYLTLNATNLTAIGTISTTTGIKLRIRATVATANVSNNISFIRLDTNTDAVSQETLYALAQDGFGVVSNIVAGSRVQIFNQTTNTEIDNVISSTSTYQLRYTVNSQISIGDTVRIRISKLGKLPQTLLAIATQTGFTAVANQLDDAIYNSNGIDGSTVTEFTADYPNVDVDINDPDGVTTVQRIYAWLRYVETTQNGIAQWFDVVDPTDDVNYEIDTSLLDLKLDNKNAAPVKIVNGRLFRSDGATIIESTSGSIQMDPNRVYLTEGIRTEQNTYNALADTFLRRSTANIEASTTGDPLSLRSMYGMVAQGTHNTYVNEATNKLVITQSNETTVLGTRSITNSPNAQPITGLDSD